MLNWRLVPGLSAGAGGAHDSRRVNPGALCDLENLVNAAKLSAKQFLHGVLDTRWDIFSFGSVLNQVVAMFILSQVSSMDMASAILNERQLL
jgi:hypothetical protein